MATDVARLSFDPARVYRGVAPQQGRVNLEAEQNEQRLIDVEERRAELIDIVGPAGTPDDGYAVSGGTGFEITVGAGTMYVGGWRLELDENLGDYDQPDWLDRPTHWAETGIEHVVLLVQETDVTAVEDPALYEVALGGPDGAARTRLLQRILRLRTDAVTCSEALEQDLKGWRRQGLSFDPETMALESDARLLVTWEGDPEPVDPCEPSSTGGYLGAENQLIRVQITRVGRDGTFDLIWGYDDASFLYRVTADASTNPVLTLDRTPVDDFHRPRAGQAVQALVATAELASTDGVVEGYVAALGGRVGVLTTPYDPDTKTVQFPAPLPTEYTSPDENPLLFLRIWEEALTGLEVGKAIPLTGTGMQVTLTTVADAPLHVDDFWCIGVRPSTPTTVYPDRYLRTPQPPDGPRMWICPLAVIEWEKESLVVLEDCRNHFRPLIDATADGCCTIEVRPSDAADGTLQALIDRATAGRDPVHRNSHVTICFEPGRYELRKPILLRRQHSNMTLRGCSEAAVLAANPDDIAEFGQGLVLLLDVDNVTITGFEFVLPQVPAAIGNVRSKTGGVLNRTFVRAVNAAAADRYVSIAIRAIECAVLAVTDCLFRYSLGEHETTPEVEQTMPRNVFGVGIFLTGGSWGLRIVNNRFLHHEAAPVDDREVSHALAGLVHVQTVVGLSTGRTATREVGAARLPALLEDAEITDNDFDGVTVAIAVAAHLGSVRIWDNVIRNCATGIALFDETASSNVDLAGEYKVAGSAPEAVAQMRTAYGAALQDPALAHVLLLAATYPLPGPEGWEPTGVAYIDLDRIDALRADAAQVQRTAMSSTVDQIVAERSSPRADAPAASTRRRAATTDFNKLDIARTSLSTGMVQAMVSLAELARVGRTTVTLDVAIQVVRNTVDCTLPETGLSGFALFLLFDSKNFRATTANVADNRLSSGNLLTAGVSGIAAATVTSNIVVGARDERSIALAVANVEAAAITGNVVAGRAVLPENRPFPPPLDTWQPLNTIV